MSSLVETVILRNAYNSAIKYTIRELNEERKSLFEKQNAKSLERVNKIRSGINLLNRMILIRNITKKKPDSPWIGIFKVIAENHNRSMVQVENEGYRVDPLASLKALFREGELS